MSIKITIGTDIVYTDNDIVSIGTDIVYYLFQNSTVTIIHSSYRNAYNLNAIVSAASIRLF